MFNVIGLRRIVHVIDAITLFPYSSLSCPLCPHSLDLHLKARFGESRCVQPLCFDSYSRPSRRRPAHRVLPITVYPGRNEYPRLQSNFGSKRGSECGSELYGRLVRELKRSKDRGAGRRGGRGRGKAVVRFCS